MCHFIKLNLNRPVPLTGRTARWCTQCVARRGYHLWTGQPHPGAHKNKTRMHNCDWTEDIKDAGSKNSESYVQKETLWVFWKVFVLLRLFFLGKVAKRTGNKLHSFCQKMETTPMLIKKRKTKMCNIRGTLMLVLWNDISRNSPYWFIYWCSFLGGLRGGVVPNPFGLWPK